MTTISNTPSPTPLLLRFVRTIARGIQNLLKEANGYFSLTVLFVWTLVVCVLAWINSPGENAVNNSHFEKNWPHQKLLVLESDPEALSRLAEVRSICMEMPDALNSYRRDRDIDCISAVRAYDTIVKKIEGANFPARKAAAFNALNRSLSGQ